MKEAGVTVGGFYKHFDSRDELVVEALAAAFQDLDRWEEHTDTITQTSRELFVRRTPGRSGDRLRLGRFTR